MILVHNIDPKKGQGRSLYPEWLMTQDRVEEVDDERLLHSLSNEDDKQGKGEGAHFVGLVVR